MAILRSLLSQRGYVALAVVTLALAVGVNIVVFTIVNALWLRPQPVTAPERVVVISSVSVGGTPTDSISARRFGLLTESPEFSAVAGQVTGVGLMGDFRPRLDLGNAGRPLEALAVTANYFEVLGIPVRGRAFSADDERPEAPATTVISDRLWRDRFDGGDVIGMTLPAGFADVTIVGIAPPGFGGARLGERADLWIPAGMAIRFTPLARMPDAAEAGSGFSPMIGLARLAPGANVASAMRFLNADRESFVVYPLSDVLGAPGLVTTEIAEGRLLGVVGTTSLLVLIAGCATLAALVLVHFERRRHELAIRLALGATRARLARRLAAELAVIAAAGVAGALLLALVSLSAVGGLSLPSGLTLSRLDLYLDWRVLAAGLGATLVVLVAAGVLPISRFTQPSSAAHLTSSAATPARSSLRLRRVLLATHTAATLVVLIGAALFVRTVAYGFGTGAGFDTDRTVFVTLQASMAQFPAATAEPSSADAERRRAVFSAFFAELRAVSGVEAVATGPAPIRPGQEALRTSTVVTAAGDRPLEFGSVSGSSAYLEALGVPLLTGTFAASADTTERPVQLRDTTMPAANVAITRSFAEAVWPTGDALGAWFEVGTRRYQVVGIVENFAQGSARAETRAGFVLASTGANVGSGIGAAEYVIRTRGRAADAIPAVRELVNRRFPDAARADIVTGVDLLRDDLGRERLGATFFSGFGVVSFALGLAGVFGLVAYFAEARRREFGVRAALGATPRDLTRLALGSGLWPVLAGTAIGVLAAGALARLVDSFLVGVGQLDPVSYAGAAALMIAGAAAAGLAAAWRIRRISPVQALRD